MSDEPIQPTAEPVSHVPEESHTRTSVREDVANLKNCALAAGTAVVVLSIAFNVYVWRQNTNLASALEARNRQLSALAQQQQRLMPALNDIVAYGQRQPQVRALLTKYGIQPTPQQPPAGAGAFTLPQGR